MAQTEANKRTIRKKRRLKPPTEQFEPSSSIPTAAEPEIAEPQPEPPKKQDNDGELIAFRSRDDLRLVARRFGAAQEDRIPLLCLPGLSRNSKDFISLGRFFSEHPTLPRQVFALDYRGRGLSDYDSDWRNYTPLTEAYDVLDASAALGFEECIVVGTSRGGLIAMMLGGIRPTLMKGVVLNDIGPVIEGTGLARIKTYLDGRRVVLRDWQAAESAVRGIMQSGFTDLTDDDWRQFTRGAFREEKGKIVPDFDKKLLKQLADIDFSANLPAMWPQFISLTNIPMLAIRGENSDLLSVETLEAMAARHPNFESLTVPGQAHPPLLTDEQSLQRIWAFASRCR